MVQATCIEAVFLLKKRQKKEGMSYPDETRSD